MDGDRLEAWWERLGQAVDRAGPDKERLFLVKLALLPGREIDDPARLEKLLGLALEDLT